MHSGKLMFEMKKKCTYYYRKCKLNYSREIGRVINEINRRSPRASWCKINKNVFKSIRGNLIKYHIRFRIVLN